VKTYTIKEITDRLQCSRERVEQWISRGFFSTANQTTPGITREWTLDDAIRLQATIELAGTKMEARLAAQHGKLAAWGPYSRGKFLVVTWFEEATTSEIVSGRDLLRHISGKTRAIVLDLDALRERVKSALGD
jgi:hypothetical protein